jgi:glycosyltransferase involved in cell wall biosynthesis
MASGRPVIAYRAGGVLETVLDGTTGLFFDEQTPESLVGALERFDTMSFDPAACREQAELFGPERFRAEFGRYLDRHLS